MISEVGSLTVSSSLPITALVIFGLLSIPTLLMGATLPLLVTYAYRQFSNVGRSVGPLYFVNTLGSALACYLTADVLFVLVGERAATVVAACLNFAVSFAVYRVLRRAAADSGVQRFTVAKTFLHQVAVGNFVAASEAPFDLTVEERRRNMLTYELPSGEGVNSGFREALSGLADTPLVDDAAELRSRTDLRIVTDDNMATEFKSDWIFFDSQRSWSRLLARMSRTGM